MLDGIAVVQFYRDFCSLARNNTVLHNPESNLRSLLKARNPPMVVFDHPEMCLPPSDPAAPPNQHGLDRSRTLTGVQAELVTKLFPFTPTMIEQLKKVAMDDGTVAKCTTFEVVVANFWLARTKTINFKPGEHSKILFSVNFRDRVRSKPMHTSLHAPRLALKVAQRSWQELN
jgi:omega-hydroxypalmitate O-feruloyl transferase